MGRTMDELLADFLAETTEGLAEADRALLQLERTPGDPEPLAVIFRAVHTIKGSCGFLPAPRLAKIAHAAEEALGRVRDGDLPATPALVTLVLTALDRIKLVVAGLAANQGELAGDDSDLAAALAALACTEPLPPPEPAPAPPTEAPAAQTIRVPVGVIEQLMTLVSELVLTRNQLLQLARTQEDSRFSAPLQRLSHLTSDLQEGVMKMRMQPIGQMSDKLARLVRDLGRDLGKRIELVMRGQDTELDRQVLELIRDPLMHMVRNSADHGLEPPAARAAAGKPETGCITLNAYHEGGYVVIELGDDGGGLRTDLIRARALARGLATEAELAAMTEPQIHRFIFRRGFTTVAAVSAVSGRGVGMDVVEANIRRLGGTIALSSALGQGTVFTIRIPLTLAIVSAFIVEARGERFALPQACVAELVRTRAPGDAAGPASPAIEALDGRPMLRLRDALLPVAHLGDLLELPPAGEAPGSAGSIVVVISVGGATLGLVVDRVFDTEEIVVKPVAPLLRHIAMFGGATILGDGSVIMILEPSGIARPLGLLGGAGQRDRPAASPCHPERSGDLTAMLLFRAAPGAAPSAVPLGLVARIENMGADQVEMSSGRAVVQYRGRLMPLIEADPGRLLTQATAPVLVFADRGRAMGLVVHEIVDVVEEKFVIELSAGRPGLLGSAVIAGRVTEVIDAGHWLLQVGQDWFRHEAAQAGRRRVLVVEDSTFFRQLLVPMLAAAGYDVTAVESAARALALRDAPGDSFDAIISDVEMPDMDGLAFARRVREGGAWRTKPLLALSGRFMQADAERGRAAGFTEYLAKLDRDTLLAALARCIAAGERRAA